MNFKRHNPDLQLESQGVKGSGSILFNLSTLRMQRLRYMMSSCQGYGPTVSKLPLRVPTRSFDEMDGLFAKCISRGMIINHTRCML